jgi:hypothetical protein
MENNDLTPIKKNCDNVDQGFGDKDISNKPPVKIVMKPEKEIDRHGKEKIVQRAQLIDEPIADETEQTGRSWNENESLSRDLSPEDLANKAAENKGGNADKSPK